MCAIASVLLTAGITSILSLYRQQGSTIREQGPESHKAKASTPSTGGRAFLITFFTVGLPASIAITDPHAIIGITAAILTGFIGLADDILKISRKNSSGLKARYKLPLQIIIGLLISSGVYYLLREETIRIPFTSQIINIGSWKIITGLLCYLIIVNAVNFTDGLDGLAASTVLTAAIFLAGVLWTTKTSSAVVPVIIIGICAGFLPYNWNPAKIFMGDSGALALGGALAAAAIATGMEIVILIIGFVFIIELTSVVLQVVYFRLTGGKRIFRMTPIHHAWELRGYKEPNIVIGFTLVGILCGAIGWWSA